MCAKQGETWKNTLFYSLIYPGYSKELHVWIKINTNLVCQDIRLSNKNGAVHSISAWWNIQGGQNCAYFQQKKITNLVINQHCLHFRRMKVNILGKCIIKIPNLQQIIVLYRVCATYIIVYSKIHIFFTFLIYNNILISMLIKTNVNLPHKTMFSIKIGTSHLSPPSWIYRVDKIMCWHHFGHPVYWTMWSSITYLLWINS